MADQVEVFSMYIDGEFVQAEGGRTLDSINPWSGSVWAKVPDATAADVNRAVEAAHRAFTSGPWPKMTPTERAVLLQKLADKLVEHKERLGYVETQDTGKLLKETTWQAGHTARAYTYFAGLADKLQGDIPPSGASMLNLVLHEPVGVVAAIIPWNSQLQLSAYKIAPALATGNTIVVKASEDASTPLLTLAKLVHEVGFPPGVINFVSGGANPCAITLTSHPLVRRIAFTGGADTARRLIPNSAHNIAKLSLELGGKSPVIVFDDADLDSCVNGIVAGIFGASGQSCAAGSRLLAHESIHDVLVERLVERCKTTRVGDPFDAATNMGPLATARQVDRIETLLASSVEQGARVVSGGKRIGGLPFNQCFEPTIALCDRSDYPIVQEELFGPVLSVLKFRDDDEAVALANDSKYAFAGGIFSRDFARAMRTARVVNAGRLWINTYRVTGVNVPFGGFKQSGYGREAGIDALKDYTETKAVMIEVGGEAVADPFVMR
ncbi:aldehyde dehydrogenase [Paraburkholderia xenovorans]|uniref:aldehyde dehydrogenase n=1 Tax=Paraburkholderia xenovorans TaxID=36873 RepID=UPI0019FEAEBE|nr:aldehyde dehydrogenase family protein [Paraburkholderia xenovorans]